MDTPGTLTLTCTIRDLMEYLDRDMIGAIRLDKDWFIFNTELFKDLEQVGLCPVQAEPMGKIKTYFFNKVDGTLSLETESRITVQFKVNENGDDEICN